VFERGTDGSGDLFRAIGLERAVADRADADLLRQLALVRAKKLENCAALPLLASAQIGALVVLGLYHRLNVLKPIPMMHKGNFPRSLCFRGIAD